MKLVEFFKNNKLYILAGALATVYYALLICCIVCFGSFFTGDNMDDIPVIAPVDETEQIIETEEETVPETEPEYVYPPMEERSHGIDVSKYQKQIDWKAVKESGVDFAFIRVGYRRENGIMYKDECVDYNLQQAESNGVKIGVYFFSTAIDEYEAREEALWVLDLIEGYRISYPVVYDCEGYRNETSRMHGLTAEQRTDNAMTFLGIAKEAGYDTMFYASRNELWDPLAWDVPRIESEHRIWVAQYAPTLYPEKDTPTYTRKCDAWQYTDKGSITGIPVGVDLDVCYFKNELAEAKAPEKRPANTATPNQPTRPIEKLFHGVIFHSCGDSVTSRDSVELRTLPSYSEGEVVYTLTRGEYLKRKAVSDQGWSKLIYNGVELYADSSYLTTEIVVADDAAE